MKKQIAFVATNGIKAKYLLTDGREAICFLDEIEPSIPLYSLERIEGINSSIVQSSHPYIISQSPMDSRFLELKKAFIFFKEK